MTAAALAAILLSGAFFRLSDLHLAHGTLGIDEARLTLVARGIAEHGWPLLPSGKAYTRGLVSSLTMAPSLALLGQTDFAARLPSAISGVLLVLVSFLYGRSLAGVGAGLLAAVLTATYPPLIAWSREAWMYSTLTLLWVLALHLFDRAVTRGSGWALVLGAGAATLAILTHELSVLMLPALGLWLIQWVRGGDDRPERLRFALGAVAMLAVGLGLVLTFALTLRSDSMAGSTSEMREFFGPKLEGSRLRFYFEEELFEERRWLLVATAVAGLVLAGHGLRRRLLLPLLAVTPLFLAAAFVIPEPQHRYILPLMATLLVVASVGATTLAARLQRWLPGATGIVAGLAACLLILLTLPSPIGLSRAGLAETGPTWIDELHTLGYQSDDLVLTDTPTIVWHYLGRTDAWLRTHNYRKYASEQWDGEPREIHTRAILVRTTADFERLVRAPNRGRVAWVIGSGRETHWLAFLDSRLRERLEEQAAVRARTSDGVVLYKLRL